MSKKSLKFLADESLEYRIVTYLRKKGYNVTSVAEKFPSIADTAVMSKAVSENRIILTNDKDFGELVFVNHLQHKGIILFRFKKESIQNKINALESLLKNYSPKIPNHFIVIEEDKFRIRG